jgi:hypothetical protein
MDVSENSSEVSVTVSGRLRVSAAEGVRSAVLAGIGLFRSCRNGCSPVNWPPGSEGCAGGLAHAEHLGAVVRRRHDHANEVARPQLLPPRDGGGDHRRGLDPVADALPVDDHAARVGEIHDEFIVVRFCSRHQDDEGVGRPSLRGGAVVVWVGSAIWPSL